MIQVVGSFANLKNVLGLLFVERELLIEDDTPTSVVLGLGPERLIAQRDSSTYGTAQRPLSGQTVSSHDHACS